MRVEKLPADVGRKKEISLGDGVTLSLVLVPAGDFVPAGTTPGGEEATRVTVRKPFWMGACEVSNEQYRRFRPDHDPKYYTRRHAASDDQGLPLNGPRQPVVRVSWDDAMAFCEWLSARTGLRFTLPTEAQGEWACRAGQTTAFSFGEKQTGFSRWANLADAAFSRGLMKDGKQSTGGLDHLVLEGAALSDTTANDGAVVTAPVGSYSPNAWGLYDLHGNAAEWTRSDAAGSGRKIVRGGSFFDPPRRADSTFRIDYPHWQRVFNTGFRVGCEGE